MLIIDLTGNGIIIKIIFKILSLLNFINLYSNPFKFNITYYSHLTYFKIRLIFTGNIDFLNKGQHFLNLYILFALLTTNIIYLFTNNIIMIN